MQQLQALKEALNEDSNGDSNGNSNGNSNRNSKSKFKVNLIKKLNDDLDTERKYEDQSTETSVERDAFIPRNIHRNDINAKDDEFHDRMNTNPFIKSDTGSRSNSRSPSWAGSNLIKRFMVNRKHGVKSFHPRSVTARGGTMGTLYTVDTVGTVDSDDTYHNRMDTLPYHYDFVPPDTITEEVTGINALAAEFAQESYVDRISMQNTMNSHIKPMNNTLNDPTRAAMSYGEF